MPKANSTQYKLYWRTVGGEYTEILPPDFEDLVQAQMWLNARIAKYPNDEWYVDRVVTDRNGDEASRTTVLTSTTYTP